VSGATPADHQPWDWSPRRLVPGGGGENPAPTERDRNYIGFGVSPGNRWVSNTLGLRECIIIPGGDPGLRARAYSPRMRG